MEDAVYLVSCSSDLLLCFQRDAVFGRLVIMCPAYPQYIEIKMDQSTTLCHWAEYISCLCKCRKQVLIQLMTLKMIRLPYAGQNTNKYCAKYFTRRWTVCSYRSPPVQWFYQTTITRQTERKRLNSEDCDGNHGNKHLV